MFTVTGFTPDNAAYRVVVGDGVRYSATDVVGVTGGSVNALALLKLHEGQEIEVTPTGPIVVLDLNDPTSVLGALYGLTRVSNVTGDDVPQVIPPLVDGAVY